ncbi:MAG: MIP family channel protein [Lachnospiraceae bacterium]|nr:MIP family channel protein [Lachnospiraceae bacterium]
MRKYIAEFIGTLVLTLFGCGAAAMTEGVEGVLGILGIAFAFGLAFIAMAYTIGDVSGCHINPAVSLAMFLDGRMSLGDFLFYLLAQFLGGFAGAGILYIILICSELDAEVLGANGYGDLSYAGINLGGAIAVEFILTLIFVLVVLSVTARYEYIRQSGLIIGFALVLVHIFGLPLTGTGINPARSLGPAVFTGADALIQVWVFIVAPLLGAVAAAFLYRGVIRERNEEGEMYYDEEEAESVEDMEEMAAEEIEEAEEEAEVEEELEEEEEELIEEELDELEDEDERKN